MEHIVLFRSKLPDICIPHHLSLTDYCLHRASEFADKPCLIQSSDGRTLTYAEVELLSRRIAAGLAAQGIRRGDVVMLLLPNCIEFVLVFLGAAMGGAITTAANPFCTAGEIAKQASASAVKLIVTHSLYADKLGDAVAAVEGMKVVTIDPPPRSEFLHFSALTEVEDELRHPLHPAIDPQDVVALPFSSGTTGLPKGVMLTHHSLVSSIAQQVDGDNPNLHYHSQDVILCVLPLFHIYSLNSVLLCCLRVCATLVIMPKFEVVAMLEAMERHRVSVAPLVPPIVLALARSPALPRYDLSSVRILKSGAAPLGKEAEDTLRERLPQAVFGQGYGMTEAGPVLAMCLAFAKHPFEVKRGSCGTVVRNAEVKIVDAETGTSLGRNEAGEICIRGPQIMKGYLNNPDATASAIDKDGFLHTGDVGYIDEDDEMFIVDRVKEIIKFKGFQVPPAELEGILTSHPAIADAACVSRSDEVCGEVPVAFVVKEEGTSVCEDEVKAYVAKQVVFYKRLHCVIFVDHIPKSPSGKILRKDLRKRLEQQPCLSSP